MASLLILAADRCYRWSVDLINFERNEGAVSRRMNRCNASAMALILLRTIQYSVGCLPSQACFESDQTLAVATNSTAGLESPPTGSGACT
jgi:hypothetical protein